MCRSETSILRLQLGVRRRIPQAPQAGIPLVIKSAVVHPFHLITPKEAPDLSKFPINDGMYTHECWPTMICRIEEGEVCPMGICATSPHEDGLNVLPSVKV